MNRQILIDHLTIIAIGIFCCIGAILRFWNIGYQYMNWDEEWTIRFAGIGISAWDLIIKSLSVDFTPPVYYLAAHFSMIVFGETATAIRIPSAIAGVLLIPVMYYVGREYKDELFGLLLAGLTTVLYNFIYYSKYGRSYSIALLFVSIAFYYFVRLLKGDKHSSIPFGIFALLCFWTHLYTLIPLGIMILYLLWGRKVYLHAIGITIIGSLPLLNYVSIILNTRIAGVNENVFGEPPVSVLLYTPLDIFAFSAFIMFPIIIWSCWKYRSDKLIRAITIISLATWISMIVLSVRTPIILHYSLFVVPMLLIPFTMPFYLAIKEREVYFHHYIVVMVLLILEAVQIVALGTIQRCG